MTTTVEPTTRAVLTGNRRARKASARVLPHTVGGWVVLALCVLGTALMLVPVYVIIATALSGTTGAPGFFLAFPDAPSLQAFASAWEKLHGSLANSLQITIPAAIISTAIGSLNGYILSKYPFKGSTVLFTILLVGMFIPFQAVIIPLFQFLNMLNLQGTILGLIVVHIIYGIPITTLIFRNYYAGIPDALVEAAAIDGAGIWRTYTRIMLPLSGPGIVVAIIFQCTNIWNDFLFGFILASPASWPAPVTLNNLIGTTTVDYSELMAGAVLVAAPTVVLYLILGRFFVRGLTAGAVK
ncbi:carbohydrate ABC transporter permease [Microcella alkaliphila]|uniref:Binding-protein-dependent transport system inner membrane protein n=1 Tax=Microcella alkaliphila TaxID=279828 RepID=A0A0U5B8U6_9MICO|nr:carbohydrate ABC transporter permease [Microcella alkaliphila]BAU31057.1 binding-protein-dependent transport system inner membrane protein [Microcella alkaliphila]